MNDATGQRWLAVREQAAMIRNRSCRPPNYCRRTWTGSPRPIRRSTLWSSPIPSVSFAAVDRDE
jgi:hypothetical protein